MTGRYTILGQIGRGGMASVYLGRMTGSAGFTRLVAIKRLHPELAAEREFVAMLVDEARVAARIRHINVIDTLDLVARDGAFSLVLEYVDGDSLSVLARRARAAGEPIPVPVALAIMQGVLRGLDAAHEARDADGHPLGIVHRDVSPQNVLVGVDGVPRIIDFGVAKAVGRLDSTRPGEVRGKFTYMAPEQLEGRPATRQADVYAAGVILWELLTGARLFAAEDQRAVCAAVLRGDVERPSARRPDLPEGLDEIVLRAIARDLGVRHLTAKELLADLDRFDRAPDEEVGAWVRRLAADRRAERQRLIDGAAGVEEQASIDSVLRELARSSASDMDLGVSAPARTPSRRHLAALFFGVALVLVAAGIGFRAARATSSAPPSTVVFPPAPVVVAAPPDPTEQPAPAAEPDPEPEPPPATTTTTTKSKPSRRAPRRAPSRSATPDPASFR